MLELSQNGVNLRSNFKELKEMKYVLEKAQTFMAEVRRAEQLQWYTYLLILYNAL